MTLLYLYLAVGLMCNLVMWKDHKEFQFTKLNYLMMFFGWLPIFIYFIYLDIKGE